MLEAGVAVAERGQRSCNVIPEWQKNGSNLEEKNYTLSYVKRNYYTPLSEIKLKIDKS
jgi:hypothetical protein